MICRIQNGVIVGIEGTPEEVFQWEKLNATQEGVREESKNVQVPQSPSREKISGHQITHCYEPYLAAVINAVAGEDIYEYVENVRENKIVLDNRHLDRKCQLFDVAFQKLAKMYGNNGRANLVRWIGCLPWGTYFKGSKVSYIHPSTADWIASLYNEYCL